METKPISISQSLASEMRTYAWEYFIAHAQARLTTFRFYIVFCTIITTGLFAVISQCYSPYVTAPLAFLLSIISYIYWKVDVRHKNLIKNAENALVWLENSIGLPDEGAEPHPLKLFQRDNYFSKQRPVFPKTSKNPIVDWHYSTCVNAVFILFGIVGIMTGIIVIIFR